MNESELEQGRRVRLLVDLDGGRYKAGDTGYLNKGGWETAEWGVVFDRDAENDMMTTNVRLETADGERVRLIDVCEPIAPVTDDLSEDTQELQPLDQQFIEAAHEMELIRQLATAHHALESATAKNTVKFTDLIGLNDKRESAINALIKFCQARWLADPVLAPIGGD